MRRIQRAFQWQATAMHRKDSQDSIMDKQENEIGLIQLEQKTVHINNSEEMARLEELEYLENAYRIPPDWDQALKHQQSVKVGKQCDEPQERETCECCGRGLAISDFDWNEDLSSLNYLGSAYSLYFRFIKCMVILILLRLLITNLWLIEIYYDHGSYCSDSTKCFEGMFSKMSLANMKGFELVPANNTLQTLTSNLNTASLIVMQIFMVVMRIYIAVQDKIVDHQLVSAADFTIIIRNLPNQSELTHDVKQEINAILQSVVEQYLQNTPHQNDITKSNNYIFTNYFIYNLERNDQLYSKLQKLLAQKSQFLLDNEKDKCFTKQAGMESILKHSFIQNNSNMDHIINHSMNSFSELPDRSINDDPDTENSQIPSNNDILRAKMMSLSQKKTNKKKMARKLNMMVKRQSLMVSHDTQITQVFNEIAELQTKQLNEKSHMNCHQMFVQLTQEATKELVLQYFYEQDTSLPKFNLDHLPYAQVSPDNHTITYRGHQLIIEQTTEPSDIIWNQIYKTKRAQQKSRVKSNLYFFGFIVICFLVMLSIKKGVFLLKSYVSGLTNVHGFTTFLKDLVGYTIFIVSFCTVLFNKCFLPGIITKIVSIQMFFSKTNQDLAYTRKYALALFFNTSLSSFISNEIIAGTYFLDEQFIASVYSMMFTLVVYQVTFQTVDINWIRKAVVQFNNFHKNRFVTQQVANLIMEPPRSKLGKSYGDILNIYYFSMFYSTLTPLCTFVGAGQLCIYYIIDKFNLLKRRSVVSTYSVRLTTGVLDLVELGLVIQCIGNIFFVYRIRDMLISVEIAVAIMCTIIYILPSHLLFNKMAEKFIEYYYKNKENITSGTDIIMAQRHFLTDYHIENPISKQRSIRKWAQRHQ